ncbi:Low-specificity L-threonine aldolase [Geobacillus sp. B4113_201601]|nr:Low-specificity L-threonine aldolase [Geobacillus sp. B4113_201601]
MAAKMLGKEDALFVTSGTQGNEVAILTHCRPGDEVILEAESHIFLSEAGAAAALAGVLAAPGIIALETMVDRLASRFGSTFIPFSEKQYTWENIVFLYSPS